MVPRFGGAADSRVANLISLLGPEASRQFAVAGEEVYGVLVGRW